MTPRPTRITAALALPLLLIGASSCESTGSEAPDTSPQDVPGETDVGPQLPPDAWRTCTEAAECALVELACCDHCNGGTLVSVNAAYQGQVEADYVAKDCEGVACTAMACEPKVPTCDGGMCGFAAQTACGALDEAACEADAQCAPLRGAPAEEVCADDYSHWMTVYGGCMQAGMGCGAAETCARDPATGAQLVFPSTCLPQGWTAVTWETCCPAGCSSRDEATCTADVGCAPIVGTPASILCSPDGPSAPQFAGCMDANQGCGDFPTCGVDPDGHRWQFMDTCVPAGWTTTAACCPTGPQCQTLTVGTGHWGACEMLMGYGFDGASCVAISGCGCDPEADAECAKLFAHLGECKAACLDGAPPRWWMTCGDPVCGGHTPPTGVPLCTAGQVVGEVCDDVGAECDPKDTCNALVRCAWSDPTQRPGGCPISGRALKRDVRYLAPDEIAALYRELRALPLATFRYRAAPADARPQLGFVLDDAGCGSPAVYDRQGKVDLYGFATMAAAAVQAQAAELEALRAELTTLRASLEALGQPRP